VAAAVAAQQQQQQQQKEEQQKEEQQQQKEAQREAERNETVLRLAIARSLAESETATGTASICADGADGGQHQPPAMPAPGRAAVPPPAALQEKAAGDDSAAAPMDVEVEEKKAALAEALATITGFNTAAQAGVLLQTLAAAVGKVALGLGRIVALYHRSFTLYHIC
jgi:hypothetical protein